MRLARYQRLLTWTALPLLVAQVGCAARSVPVTPSGAPVAISAAERTACEELVRAESSASPTSATSAPPFTAVDLATLPLGLAYLVVTGAIFIVPFALPIKAIGDARAAARDREAAVTRCLEPVIQAATLGPDHPDVAWSLRNLAYRYVAVGNDTRADALYLRALAIQEKALGPDHPDVAYTLGEYAALLRKMKREAEAEEMEARAQAIRASHERLRNQGGSDPELQQLQGGQE